jgi:hypothetical protein
VLKAEDSEMGKGKKWRQGSGEARQASKKKGKITADEAGAFAASETEVNQ